MTRAWMVAVLILVGCSAPERRSTDPLVDIRNPALRTSTRIQASDEAWQRVEDGQADRMRTREAFKSLAWSPGTARSLRIRLLSHLLDDTSDEGVADAQEMTYRMLPREGDRAVVVLLSETAGTRGWTDVTPALVRSWSRPVPGVDDVTRTERVAIEALHPGRDAEQVVFEVFLDAETDGSDHPANWAMRRRSDAWNLLSRLDPDASKRQGLIERTPARPRRDDPLLAALQDGWTQLRCMPDTGEELQWLVRLHTDRDEWWSGTREAVAMVRETPSHGHEMRHLEPIRLASTRRPELLDTSRETLLSLARTRLEGRRVVKRTARETHERARERLSDWEDGLSWGDLLSLLMVDDALRDPRTIEAVFTFAELDREDRTTEYGGVIEALPDGGSRAVVFPPRPRDRTADDRFVASQDMIDYGSTGLALYHFHAQKEVNSQYAGPSLADLETATRLGQTSVVLTSIGEDRMDADLYLPDGAVIDLGEIRR